MKEVCNNSAMFCPTFKSPRRVPITVMRAPSFVTVPARCGDNLWTSGASSAQYRI